MLSKIKGFIKSSKGPFTKEGAYIDYTELHVFQNAVLYGITQTSCKKGWEKSKKKIDGAEEEYTYHHYGYAVGNKGKIAFVASFPALAAKFGLV